MTDNNQPAVKKSGGYAEKMLVATGSIAALYAMGSQDALAVEITANPFTNAMSNLIPGQGGDPIEWDIDYDGNTFEADAKIVLGTAIFSVRSTYTTNTPSSDPLFDVAINANGDLHFFASKSTVDDWDWTDSDKYSFAAFSPAFNDAGCAKGDCIVGFRFGSVFGWIDIAYLSSTNNNGRVVWTMTADGATKDGGRVPEPSSLALALLGLGAAGVTRWRGRRKAV